MNNLFAITHEFDGNVCKLKIPIAKCVPASLCQNCDVFVDDHNLVFVADSEVKRFKCERRFDTKDMKDIPLAFDSERYEYTCRLPCYPDDSEDEKIVKSEESPPGCSHSSAATTVDLTKLLRITDSCVFTVDGKVSGITADYGYGFADRYRGSPKYSENELSKYCRLTTPNARSPIRRQIQREKDEAEDFRPDHYKTNFFELQQPDGHENPMQYTRSCESTKLTKDEEAILSKITAKEFIIKLDAQQMHTDFGLISILLAICYDIRTTYNEPTCESPWTRTVLSATFSYFERFENLSTVVESFLRRSLIYPLYRNFDLSMLCIEDAVEALQKGKAWILKQLLVTYCGFGQAEIDRRALKRYFLRDYIRYVSSVLDNDHLHMLSMNLKNIKLDSSKKQLRLGLAEIESELLMELLGTIHLTTLSEVKDVSSGDSECDTNAICESEFSDDDDDESSVEEDAREALDIGW